MVLPFPLSNRATDVRSGCKTQRIAPTLRQVADSVCAGTKERENFKTSIVGHVNCCLQCGPTLRIIVKMEVVVMRVMLMRMIFIIPSANCAKYVNIYSSVDDKNDMSFTMRTISTI
ncbi:hypothetical protein PoB_001559800 [Plakobranchus ocellatus]|uniref:Uncharacterized protein n=1 Tax=Plakobranchus ocellatus TaxID=259542 RepID=A0AAV3Z3P4_9GAST|nr:hypothetical protein PoB_001559800 [Plakobranchus ocellatus]